MTSRRKVLITYPYLYLYLYLHLSIWLSIYLSIYLSMYIYIHIFIYGGVYSNPQKIEPHVQDGTDNVFLRMIFLIFFGGCYVDYLHVSHNPRINTDLCVLNLCVYIHSNHKKRCGSVESESKIFIFIEPFLSLFLGDTIYINLTEVD